MVFMSPNPNREASMATAQSPHDGLKEVRVVVFHEENMYVAQCLEYDIATQAPDIEAVLDRLDLTLEAECQMSIEATGTPLAGIPPAPIYFHTLWEKGSVAITRKNLSLERHLPSFNVVLAKAA
jgi:hypothetical protein